MKPVTIIGMGLSPEDLTEKHLSLIRHAGVLVGGKRHLSFFQDLSTEKIAITKHIRELVQDIRRLMETENVVVLASGDPLFYGIGTLLTGELGQDNVEIFPNVNSVAGSFSKIKESWHDAAVISLHGRGLNHEVLQIIRNHTKTAVFTDPVNNPAVVAAFLSDNRVTRYEMCVLEQLGSDAEAVDWYSIDVAAGKSFRDPNMVILKRKPEDDRSEKKSLYVGMPDKAYTHRNGLITKPEVRAVTLSKLQLKEGLVMWDLGAGSGSVSVEASLFIGSGVVCAVEQHAERIEDIRANVSEYASGRVDIIHATLPEGLDALPSPDRVFIGGGGSNLSEIIQKSAERLNPDGIIVVNTVLLSNIENTVKTFEKLGFIVDIVQIQVSTGHDMPWDRMMKAQNPVWIIKGSARP